MAVFSKLKALQGLGDATAQLNNSTTQPAKTHLGIWVEMSELARETHGGVG